MASDYLMQQFFIKMMEKLDAQTALLERQARAMENLVDLYAVANGQIEELYRLRDGQW